MPDEPGQIENVEGQAPSKPKRTVLPPADADEIRRRDNAGWSEGTLGGNIITDQAAGSIDSPPGSPVRRTSKARPQY